MCGAQSDPIIRNAQEARQLGLISAYLTARGYVQKNHPSSKPVVDMPPGTFGLRMGVVGIQVDRNAKEKKVNIPIDVVVQPHNPRHHRVPILIECKSAGDFTNVNKRRKEEAAKIGQIHKAPDTGEAEFILFLCGYFDGQYLGYEAFEGIDWIWEHRDPGHGSVGIMTDLLSIEERRLLEQNRLDRLKSADERNEWGQFATPPPLAVDILQLARTLWSTQRQSQVPGPGHRNWFVLFRFAQGIRRGACCRRTRNRTRPCVRGYGEPALAEDGTLCRKGRLHHPASTAERKVQPAGIESALRAASPHDG